MDVINRPELVGFLRSSAGRRFAWGECDCLLWAAEWVALCRGVDVAAELRGTYSEALGARRLVEAYGGEIALADYFFGRVGIERTDDPLLGDVGLVRSDLGIVCAIRLLRGWAVKADLGVTIDRADHLAAWSV